MLLEGIFTVIIGSASLTISQGLIVTSAFATLTKKGTLAAVNKRTEIGNATKNVFFAICYQSIESMFVQIEKGSCQDFLTEQLFICQGFLTNLFQLEEGYEDVRTDSADQASLFRKVDTSAAKLIGHD